MRKCILTLLGLFFIAGFVSSSVLANPGVDVDHSFDMDPVHQNDNVMMTVDIFNNGPDQVNISMVQVYFDWMEAPLEADYSGSPMILNPTESVQSFLSFFVGSEVNPGTHSYTIQIDYEELGQTHQYISPTQDDFHVAGGMNDRDDDGVADSDDAFPDDPSEWQDSDNDGVGDNSDAFPNDPSESQDSDMDGIGDNSDAFPDDPSESQDSDMDGIGDNSDEFPDDPDNDPGDGSGDGGDFGIEMDMSMILPMIMALLVTVVIASVVAMAAVSAAGNKPPSDEHYTFEPAEDDELPPQQ